MGSGWQGFLVSSKGTGLSLRVSIYMDRVVLLPVTLTVSTHHLPSHRSSVGPYKYLRRSEGRPIYPLLQVLLVKTPRQKRIN